MIRWIKYGTQSDIRFTMVKRAVVDLAVSADWTPATADCAISKDGGNYADATNTIAIVGGTPTRAVAGWKLTLSATEAQAAEINIQIVDAATKAVEDNFLTVYTYGNASAKFVGDWSDIVRLGLTALPNAAAEAAGGLYTRGTGAGQIRQDANGRIDANAKAWVDGAIPAVNVTGVPLVDVNDIAGAALATHASGMIPADVRDLLGTAWLAPAVAGTPDVNAKQLGGTAQTGRDVGASVLLSSGSGTGQLDFTSGVVKANQTQVNAHAVTDTTNGVQDVNAKNIGNTAQTGRDLGASVLLTASESRIIRSATAQAGAASTITLDASASATDSLYVGEQVKIDSGTGAGQTRTIITYVGSTKVATVDRAWQTNPDATSVFTIQMADAPKLDSSLQVTAASVQGNVTGSVGSVTGAVGSVTGNVGGNVVGSVASVTARVTANTDQLNGTGLTGRDIGASVLLSSGTGTGQLDFTSGVVKANLVQILATALTETAGLLAGGFKKFFNIATPTGTLNSLPDAVPGAAGGLLVDDVWTDARAAKLDNLDATVSSRLAPTTAGRTLDVAATGEAGLDFDNIHDASGAHTLTNITVPTTTGVTSRVTANTDQVNGVTQTGGDIYEAVTNIAVTSAALNTTAGSRTITTGTGTGGVANTTAADLVYDNVADSGGAIDFYYEFDISGTSGSVGVGAEWLGYLVGVVNTLKVFAYNWGGASWDQVGLIVGIAGTVNMTNDWELTSAHTGTGGNLGLVRIRFQNTGLTAATVKTDRILLGYAVIPPTVSAIQSGLATSSAVAAVQTDVTEINADVDEIISTIGAAGAGLTAIPDSSTVTEIGADVDELITTIGVAGVGLTNLGDSRIANLDATVSSRTKPADTQARVTLVDTLTTYTGNTPQTGDAFARLGAPAGASVSVDIAEANADLDEIITTLGVAGAGLTAIPDSSTVTEIGADVDELITTVGVAGAGLTALPAGTLTAGERTAVADALLDRDMAAGVDTGSPTKRTPRQGWRALRNRFDDSTGVYKVYKEDDATLDWDGTMTTDATALPIVGVNPTGP